MKVYKVEDLETFEKDEYGYLICPTGDYSQIKNYERLTISKGEIKFYDSAYNKCSNHNAPEIREKINNGTLVCDIEEYQSCSYTTKELRDMYSRLSKLEDMIEQGKLVELEVKE